MEKPIVPDVKKSATLYTDEEAQEILSRAMGLGEEGVTHESLARMASELGVSPAELERAEAEFRASSATAGDRAAFHAERLYEVRVHALAYALTVAFLWLFFGFLAAFVARNQAVIIPPLIITFAWGIGIAFHVMDYLSKRSGPAFEASFESWQASRARKREWLRLADSIRRRLEG